MGARESVLEAAFAEPVGGVAEYDAVTTRLLDAAHDQFCRMGIRRSTMEDVARRAGVSRITLYRRFATKDALVEHVVRREFRRYLDQFSADIESASTVAERVVAGFVSSLRAIRNNPLIGGLMAVEPDAVVPSLVSDGRTLAVIQQFLAARLHREQQAGNIARGLDLDLVAELMVRTAASFLLIPSQVVDLDDEEQLRTIAWRFLVPMLDPPAG